MGEIITTINGICAICLRKLTKATPGIRVAARTCLCYACVEDAERQLSEVTQEAS